MVKTLLSLVLLLSVAACNHNDRILKKNKDSEASVAQPERKYEEDKTDKKHGEASSENEGKNISLETRQLLIKQKNNFPSILSELKKQGRKISHWIWWVFPTEKPGASEPLPKTKIEEKEVEYVLQNTDVDQWAEILEEIFGLLKQHQKGEWKTSGGNIPNSDIIPAIDHGRIEFALTFWLTKAHDELSKRPRLFKAFANLRNFAWYEW
ncbi:MAG: DUF1810 family protein [Myxococcales bacterium]|nr:DUF1810 family protein [Myxococcales bacterium]USN51238.1 MAG: DUF1810 family protein [Myxococcales bacterium]